MLFINNYQCERIKIRYLIYQRNMSMKYQLSVKDILKFYKVFNIYFSRM